MCLNLVSRSRIERWYRGSNTVPIANPVTNSREGMKREGISEVEMTYDALHVNQSIDLLFGLVYLEYANVSQPLAVR